MACLQRRSRRCAVDRAEQVNNMTSEVPRISRKARARIVAGLKRSWAPGGTHREMQLARGLRSDAETERKRALYDARGRLLFTAVLPDGTQLEVRRSTHGRTDQLDLGPGFTARPDLVMKELLTRSYALTR